MARSRATPGSVASGLRFHALAAALLCALAAGLYANTLHAPFYFDDKWNIPWNAPILIESLDAESLWGAAFRAREPRPVSNLTLALNHWAGGLEVFGYHAVNVAIHALNGLLVYLVALALFRLARAGSDEGRRDGRLGWAALFVAAVFVAHPVQIQSVTYVVQRMNSLAVTFYLLAWLGFVHGRLVPARRALAWSGAGVAWILALGSKQITATLPVLLLLTEAFFFRENAGRWLWRNRAVLALPAGFLLLLTVVYLGGDPFERLRTGYALRDFTMAERLWTQPRVVWFYASLLALPLPGRFNLLHAFETSRGLFDPATTALAIAGIGAALALAFAVRRRQPLLAFGILWFFLHLVIESSFISLEMVFEHRLYLPMVGLALPLGHWLLGKKTGRTGVVIAVLLVLGLGVSTVLRNEVWRDPVRFWSDTVAKNPNQFRTHHQLAGAYVEADRPDDAIASYRRALEIADHVPQVHHALAQTLQQAGRDQEAEPHLERAAELYRETGIELVSVGANVHAAHNLQLARELRPNDARIYNLLGILARRFGDADASLRYFEWSATLDPNVLESQLNLGMAYAERGDLEQAISHLEHAVTLDATHEPAREALTRAREQLESARAE